MTYSSNHDSARRHDCGITKRYSKKKNCFPQSISTDILSLTITVAKITNSSIFCPTKQPFIPHLCGVYSTQVSRLLHTCVAFTPFKCGLKADCEEITDVLLKLLYGLLCCLKSQIEMMSPV